MANCSLCGPCTVCSLLRCRRTKLALLAGCIPVTPALQRVAGRTMQLASKLGVLVDVGLLWRFRVGYMDVGNLRL